MLKYRGTGLSYTRDGKPCEAENYTIEAAITSVSDAFLQFGELKHFQHGFTLPGEFRVDFERTHVEFPEKKLDMAYFNHGEAAGSIAIQGETFSMWSSAKLSQLRNILVGSNRIWVEELFPDVDSMSDLSDQERKVLDFVTTKATSFLNVNALILIGSRANRTHTPQSDFDIVIDGRGGPMAWNLLRDAVRNEAPTLAGIDIIAAESIQKQGFFTSIYSQGRFFYGPACSTPAQT